jgi:hypothetical protein
MVVIIIGIIADYDYNHHYNHHYDHHCQSPTIMVVVITMIMVVVITMIW